MSMGPYRGKCWNCGHDHDAARVEIDWLGSATQTDAAPAALSPQQQGAEPVAEQSIALNLAQARALVEFFGGEDTEAKVARVDLGHSGAGLYVWCADYPEEGSVLLDADALQASPTPSPAGAQERLSEEQMAVLKFLWGAGNLRGAGFGGLPEGEKRPFWWRKELTKAFPALLGTSGEGEA